MFGQSYLYLMNGHRILGIHQVRSGLVQWKYLPTELFVDCLRGEDALKQKYSEDVITIMVINRDFHNEKTIYLWGMFYILFSCADKIC